MVIGELADVMDVKSGRLPAHLALTRQEPVQQLVASAPLGGRCPVEDLCRALPLERNAPEGGDQWLPSAVTRNRDLQAQWNSRCRE
ncbi:hypothetical protein [Streptomyces sp. NPDC059957]|uniref:hypothetical protein n=1 Tax=unclassified Streptomyces TaxID=2593676 RepID=UPI003655D582